MRQVLALLCVKRRIEDTEAHTGSCKTGWETNARFKPKLPMSYTAEETRNEIVGITELVK